MKRDIKQIYRKCEIFVSSLVKKKKKSKIRNSLLLITLTGKCERAKKKKNRFLFLYHPLSSSSYIISFAIKICSSSLKVMNIILKVLAMMKRKVGYILLLPGDSYAINLLLCSLRTHEILEDFFFVLLCFEIFIL